MNNYNENELILPFRYMPFSLTSSSQTCCLDDEFRFDQNTEDVNTKITTKQATNTFSTSSVFSISKRIIIRQVINYGKYPMLLLS